MRRTHPLPLVTRPEGLPRGSARHHGALAEALQERQLLCAARLHRRSFGRAALRGRLLQRLLKRHLLLWLLRLVLGTSEKHASAPQRAASSPQRLLDSHATSSEGSACETRGEAPALAER